MKNTKKTIASVILCSMIFLNIGLPVRAGYWTENYSANTVDTIVDQAWATLQAMILKALKQASIKTLQEQIEKMVSGAGGDDQIIANYEDFIHYSDLDTVESYLGDFFSSVQTGASPGEREMLRNVEQALSARLSPVDPVTTLHEIVQTSDPMSDVFNQVEGGGVKAMLSYEFGEYNNPFNAYINTERQLTEKLENVQTAAEAESIAGQGFETMVNGNRVMPGSVYQDLIAQVEGAPIDMITNATNWQEVVVSFATSLIGSAIKNGIETTSNPEKTDEKRVNQQYEGGYAEIQNSIYQGN